MVGLPSTGVEKCYILVRHVLDDQVEVPGISKISFPLQLIIQNDYTIWKLGEHLEYFFV